MTAFVAGTSWERMMCENAVLGVREAVMLSGWQAVLIGISHLPVPYLSDSTLIYYTVPPARYLSPKWHYADRNSQHKTLLTLKNTTKLHVYVFTVNRLCLVFQTCWQSHSRRLDPQRCDFTKQICLSVYAHLHVHIWIKDHTYIFV